MSRWAEMFAALSRGSESIETIATIPPSTAASPIDAIDAIDSHGVSAEPAPVGGATIIAFGAGVIPRSWSEGVAALASMPAPSGFSPERWQRIVDAAGVFVERWGTAAARCGWSDLDVFGCDGAAPAARFDCMGLVLLLDRREVVAIDELGADLITASGARQRFRRRPLPPGTINLWGLHHD